MILPLILALQAGGQAPSPSAPAAIDFDLARYRPASPEPWDSNPDCVTDNPTEVVVCGRRPRAGAGSYPLEDMARLFMPGRIVAETRLSGNATGAAFVESVELAPGITSNRAMVGIRLGF